MKGKETSKGIAGFDYHDIMAETIGMTMIKEDSIWKIDGLEMPKFEKINLPQGSDSQAE